jgi:dethiobiotin synthetase
MIDFPKNLFITGTDTGIGKTVVSAMLTLGLKATYWKPVQSGLDEETDTEAVKRWTHLPSSHFRPETYRLSEPLSPHASAAIDGVQIQMNDFRLPDYNTDHLMIEGAGGVLVPLNEDSMMIDLMAQLQTSALIVVRSELGTLNHTFLTLEALRKRNIPIFGVIMNGPQNESNRKAIEDYGDVEVLGELEPMDEVNAQSLMKAFERIFG